MARLWHCNFFMAEKSLEERVCAIEAQLAGKTLETHFREQAELIDQLFMQRDKKWDVRFARVERDVGSLKSDVGTLKTDVSVLKTDVSVLKTDVSVLKTDVSVLKTDVSVLKTDVSVLKKDVAVVREGISILLKNKAE